MVKRQHKYCPVNMSYHGEKKRNGPIVPKSPMFFPGILAIDTFLDMQLMSVVEFLAIDSTRQTAVTAINESVLKELNADNMTYSDLINLRRDADGEVQTITTNAAKANEIRAKVTGTAQKNLHGGKISTSVPPGTLLNSRLSHGCDPDAPLVATLKGNVEPDFKTSSESAGINQTRRQTYLELHAEIYSFIPGLHAAMDVATSVLIAETIIVGDVPQFHLGG